MPLPTEVWYKICKQANKRGATALFLASRDLHTLIQAPVDKDVKRYLSRHVNWVIRRPGLSQIVQYKLILIWGTEDDREKLPPLPRGQPLKALVTAVVEERGGDGLTWLLKQHPCVALMDFVLDEAARTKMFEFLLDLFVHKSVARIQVTDVISTFCLVSYTYPSGEHGSSTVFFVDREDKSFFEGCRLLGKVNFK